MLGRRVSIKFCGGCNPQINRAEIAREVGKHLSSHGLTVVFNSFDADFIVHLSGCSSNCAQKFSNSDIP